MEKAIVQGYLIIHIKLLCIIAEIEHNNAPNLYADRINH